MMTIEEMNSIREELGLTYQKICMESGVPIGTIQKVLGGITKNPRMETMKRLEDTLGAMKRAYDKYHEDADQNSEPAEQNKAGKDVNAAGQHTNAQYVQHREMVYEPGNALEGIKTVREEQAVYNASGKNQEDKTRNSRNGSDAFAGVSSGSAPYVSGSTAVKEPHLYTVADREALPDWRRTELIDGVLYDMASPSMPHQDICGAIYRQIVDCIREHHSQCHVFIAPADVCLDCDDYTMVQPDVFIVCDRKQITRKNIQGAPAFILEVLSPSNRQVDKKIKMLKYVNAGVKEYWIIDPDRKQIVAFDMTNCHSYEDDPYNVAIYGFSDKIPLAISEGKCIIDMDPVNRMLDELYSD